MVKIPLGEIHCGDTLSCSFDWMVCFLSDRTVLYMASITTITMVAMHPLAPSVINVALNHFSWSVALAWVIFACATGYGDMLFHWYVGSVFRCCLHRIYGRRGSDDRSGKNSYEGTLNTNSKVL
ncbi:uncharacterized protein LOC110464028 [Mizuhopecten yessoensis]|uniref:uncharacterized protein LOC110464028 n=1 Tax=Mizuhopecten yessoensis TaxID=6573 RepID=UPI000B45D938|nr:uncharacterized protein LOC110464028 [Mizuhopecten yessoensis]